LPGEVWKKRQAEYGLSAGSRRGGDQGRPASMRPASCFLFSQSDYCGRCLPDPSFAWPAVRQRPLLSLPLTLLRVEKSHWPRAYKQSPPFENGTKVLGLPNEAWPKRQARGALTKPALNQTRRTVRAGETELRKSVAAQRSEGHKTFVL